MALRTFDITLLPLELFRAVLLEAMYMRGTKRAMRLRLVNSFFATEVMRLVETSRFLEECTIGVYRIGALASDFMARRLLTTTLPVSARWDGYRRIARILAAEDDTQDSYAGYVTLLCHRASDDAYSIERLCDEQMYRFEHYPDYLFPRDLMCAAAYTNKLSIIDELGNSLENLKDRRGDLGNPYLAAAAEAGNHAAVDLLFSKLQQHGQDVEQIRAATFPSVCKTGDMSMVRTFLPEWSKEALAVEPPPEIFVQGMETPSIEVFEMLRAMKRSTKNPDLSESLLNRLLVSACASKWDVMAKHLLDMGAPVHQLKSETGLISRTPLRAAIQSRSHSTARLLLRYSAPMLRNASELYTEFKLAAKYDHWYMVWILIDEFGVDPNAGLLSVLSWAIEQEREREISALVDRGAKLNEWSKISAVKFASRDGCESMLEWMRQRGVDVAGIQEKLKTKHALGVDN